MHTLIQLIYFIKLVCYYAKDSDSIIRYAGSARSLLRKLRDAPALVRRFTTE